MGYALSVGLRYLRSKKRSTVSVITVIAVTGVALGVGSLLSVMSITAGFQDAFREKILGVNAHVLVLKYGLDFSEYPEVADHARSMPQVAGAAPFLIHEMMLAKGDRLGGVLVKGVDPELLGTVLDLPEQLVEGDLDSLRLPGSGPPSAPSRARSRPVRTGEQDLEALLATLGEDDAGQADAGARPPPEDEPPPELPRVPTKESGGDGAVVAPVAVPTPAQMEQALSGVETAELQLPDDDFEADLFEDEVPAPGEGEGALPGVIVGAALAESLDLKLGDPVRIISPLAGLDTSLWSSETSGPRSRDFQVSGIFSAGFQEYDSRLVYVDLYEAQRFFDHGDTVTGVEIRLHDIDEAPFVARRIESDLGGAPYHTMDWQELNHHLFTALEVQKVMLSLVIGIIIVVAAFNVIATLIMVVLEKKREVAILKAMGARDSGILVIFLVQGLVIGLLGTVIGLVLGGALIAYLDAYTFPLDPKVYLIDHLPVRVSPEEFLWTVLVAVSICLTATLIPSWWAARLLPADGVRYE